MNEDHSPQTTSESDGTYTVLNKIVSIFAVIVYTIIFVFLILLVIFGYQMIRFPTEGGNLVMTTVSTDFWAKFLPLANMVLTAMGTALIVLVAFASARLLITPSTRLDLSRIISDFPSLIAIIVIITISLLSLIKIGIPDVLSNIALVIVGFYFGKATKPISTNNPNSTNTTSETMPRE